MSKVLLNRRNVIIGKSFPVASVKRCRLRENGVVPIITNNICIKTAMLIERFYDNGQWIAHCGIFDDQSKIQLQTLQERNDGRIRSGYLNSYAGINRFNNELRNKTPIGQIFTLETNLSKTLFTTKINDEIVLEFSGNFVFPNFNTNIIGFTGIYTSALYCDVFIDDNLVLSYRPYNIEGKYGYFESINRTFFTTETAEHGIVNWQDITDSNLLIGGG